MKTLLSTNSGRNIFNKLFGPQTSPPQHTYHTTHLTQDVTSHEPLRHTYHTTHLTQDATSHEPLRRLS